MIKLDNTTKCIVLNLNDVSAIFICKLTNFPKRNKHIYAMLAKQISLYFPKLAAR